MMNILSNNYTLIHCHTELSNGTTNIDSITKYQDYINKAKELGMTAIAFTEHGNIYRHSKKRDYCKSQGIKYIHGVEIYITETLDKKIRDNYHCCLYAKNLKGFLELNTLVSHKIAFNRSDNHFYYVPRISIDELINTSDNIVVSTACLGSILNNGTNAIKDKYIEFLKNNRHRCFIEIQHHNVEDQIKYNKYLYELSKKIDVPLIVGTDTHALNEIHLIGRKVLQESKDIRFDNEFGWDLTMKSYDELIEAYKEQDSLPLEIVKKALENTNVLSDMIEMFDLDDTPKFPKLYEDPIAVFKQKINEGVVKRGIDKYQNYESEYLPRIYEEFDTYVKCNAVDYMLLQDKILADARESGNVQPGYGRGSCNGSLIAYLLNITDMDSVKFGLLFFRFLNPNRISLPDIDTDYCDKDRDWVIDYLFHMDKINASTIITFNTIALKGAIRDVGRYMKKIKPNIYTNETINAICQACDEDREEEVREQYKDLFEYVDILNGTIVSVSRHASGFLVSDLSLEDNIGTCTIASCDYPVTMIDMKEIDRLNWIKLDCLGLDTIGIINETSELLSVERPTPDTIDIYDDRVWSSIVEDTTNIFQMESDMAHQYLKKIMTEESLNKIKERYPSIRKFDLFQLVCSMIRPGGASMREDASNGICKSNGIEKLDNMLGDTLGYLLLQEQIMQFLMVFCNYSEAESDTVRRAIGKKQDIETFEKLTGEIRSRFMSYAPRTFNLDENLANNIINDTIQTILDASKYSFSKNHNYPYSYTGYIAGYLRYYHPLEFATACLNTWTRKKDNDKINSTTNYIKKIGIKLNPPKFRYSRADYFMDKENKAIYKGVESIKYLNRQVAEDLYGLRDCSYKNFLDLLIDIHEKKINIDARQMGILISIDYFSEFGKAQYLFDILELYNNIMLKKYKSKVGMVTFSKGNTCNVKDEIIKEFACKESDKQYKVEDAYGLCCRLINDFNNIEMSSIEKVRKYIEMVGSCNYNFEDYNPCTCVVVDTNTKYKNKTITLYNISKGKQIEVKIGGGIFEYQPLEKLDVIDTFHFFQKPKKTKIQIEALDKNGNVILDENGKPKKKDKWVKKEGEFELWCDEYHLYSEDEIDLINKEEKEYRLSLLVNKE